MFLISFVFLTVMKLINLICKYINLFLEKLQICGLNLKSRNPIL